MLAEESEKAESKEDEDSSLTHQVHGVEIDMKLEQEQDILPYVHDVETEMKFEQENAGRARRRGRYEV